MSSKWFFTSEEYIKLYPTVDTSRMEEDPDGKSQQVAVIMTGQVYRDAGLKYSKHPIVEGLLYDKLCEIGKHRLRDDVRKMALGIAMSVSDKEFKPTVEWLDNFMRRFCLSKKKMGFHSSAMLKQKISAKSEETPPPLFRINKLTQEDVLNALGINVEGGGGNDVSVDNNDTTLPVENGKSKGEVSSGQNGSQVEVNGEQPPEVDPFKDAEPIAEIKIEPEHSLSEKISDGQVTKDANKSSVTIKEEPKDSTDKVSNSDTNLSTSEKETGNSSIQNGIVVEENLVKKESVDTNLVNEKEGDLQLQNKNSNNKPIAEKQIRVVAFEKLSNGNDKNLNDSSRSEKTVVEDKDNDDKEKEADSSNDTANENEEETSNSSESDEDSSQSSDDNEAGSEASDDDDDKDGEAKQKSQEENKIMKTRQEEDEIINYSKEEDKYYQKNYDELVKRLSGSVIRCTSCNEQVNHQLRSLVHTHPVLKVFICKRCRKYYGKGKYCKDEEGYDEYCRLCAEGGDLLCCEQENCFNGFCKRCVKRTMGRSELKNAETTENWACYVCDPSPMMELRALHRTILSNLKNSEEQDANLSRNELRTKNMKKKFDVLKKQRIERALLESPEKKTVKKGSRNAKSTSAKKSKEKVPEDGIQSWLREAIDNMSEMLSLCMKNVKTIDSKWKENKYSQEATEKAGKRIMKQLHAVRNNFEIMECELENNVKQFTESVSSGSKELTEKPDVEAEDCNAQSTSGKDLNTCQESDEIISNSKLCEDKKKEIHKNKKTQKKSTESEDSDGAGNVEDKSKVEGKMDKGKCSSAKDAKSNKVEDSPMEVDDCQDSSKAALSSDDGHSLPDLENNIGEMLSDGSNDVGAPEHDVSDEENEDAFDRLKKEPTRRSTRSTRSTREREKLKDKQPETRQKRKNAQRYSEGNMDDDDLKDDAKSSAEEHNESEGDSKKSRTSRRLRKLKAESNDEDSIFSEAELKKKSSTKSKKDKASTIDKSESEIDNDDNDDEKLKSSVSQSEKKDSEESEEEKSGKVEKDVKMKDSKADENDAKKKIKVQKQDEEEEKEEKDEKNVKNLKDDDIDNWKGDIKELKEEDGKSKRVKEVPNEDDDEDNQDDTKTTKDDLNEDDEKMEEKQGSDDEEDDDRVKKTKEKKNTEDKEGKHSKKRRRHEERGEKKRGNKHKEDERVLRKRNKPKKEEDKKMERLRRHQRRGTENKDEDSQECRKSTRKRNKRKTNDEDEDEDVLLGLVEDSSESSVEEDTDEEMRRREADREPVKKKKRKAKKSKKESEREEDGEEEKENGEEEKEDGDEEKEDGDEEKEDGDEEEEGEKVEKEEDEGKDLDTVKTKNKKKLSKHSKEKDDEEEEQSESEQYYGKSSEAHIEGNKEKHKKASRKEQSKENQENEKALSTLLASDSGGEGETNGEGQAKKESDEPCKKIVSETSSNSEESTSEKKKKKIKKKSKDGKPYAKNDNQKAKAALLESESEDDLEDKPKPRCKKKNYKKSLKKDEVAKKQLKTLRKTLTEEEREELKEKQLKDKCQVDLTELSSSVKDKIKEEDFVYVTDFPELYLGNRRTFDSDDCDADEEESDKEFTKLMNFKMTKYSKPAPKCKKKFVKSESEQEEEGEDEEGENDDVDEKENKSNKKVKKEGAVKKKKEGLLDISIDKEDEDEDEEEEDEDENGGDKNKKKKKEGGISLNEKMKKQILMSSDEEDEEDEQDETLKEDPEEEEKERKKYEEKKRKKEEEKQQQGSGEESGEEYVPKVYKKGYMNLNISSEDEDGAEDEKAEIESDDENDSDFEESPRKKRSFQISSSDSEDDKKRKRKKASSSDYNSEDEEDSDKPKAKRKRIKKMTSSSDDDDEDDEKNKEESPSKHKKIRRVIRDEDLLETTKNATQEEEERRKRIKERQKQYNQIFEIDVESDQKELGKLVLDFDPETKAELVSVHEKLVKFLKPHQFKGIKFMWDATIESLEMLKENTGSGCILAHCMGLGKTLQVITFVHTLLLSKKTNRHIQRVMVCCPVNTVYNWVSEFSNWLKGKMLPFDVVELASAKDLWGRAYRLDDWWREGGVCIIGYDMFRNLSNSKCKRYKGKMKEIFQKTLINPGPDLMVCDEGHILKNEATALSKAITQINTKRRIVLTGTPLQNNLKEYHCMIQFVKPNLLGTKKEFMNRFVNPIEQGQCVDAMPRDVRRMKRRAHILHNLLEGCVQRFDYTVLKPFLPPKFEFVISVQLSEIQCKLYQYYLDNLAQGGPKRQGSGLFVDFNCLSRVWTHPKVLELAVRRALFNDEEEELDDFICDDTTTSDSSEDERSRKKKKKKEKKKNEESEEEELKVEEFEKPGPIPGLTESGKVRVDWWKKVIDDNISKDEDEADFLDKLEHSGKLILLLDILRECSSIGDKVLVFSQSLLALDMIEEFLQLIDEGTLDLPQPEDPLPLPFKQWKKERDYLRLDGSSSADTRKNMCKVFNNPTNERCRLFLISTRAGGLGINLVAANRVIIFDSSWNPSHDTQSIFRIYRFGQKKPCYVYRFVAQGTMEEKIYSRQVTKMSTALRVVDEHQIKRYFKMDELAQLYEFTPADADKRDIPNVPEDRLLAEMLKRHKNWIVDYHEQDSLLENQTSEELTEEERTAAWEDYENEKKGFMVQQQRNSVMPVVGNPTMMANASSLPSLSLSSFSFEGVVNTIKAQNPNLTQQEMCESVVLATKQIQKIHLNHYQRVQGMVYNLKNPMIAPEQRKLLPFGNHPEMLPMLEQQLRMLEENIQRENQVINHMSQITPQRDQVSMASLMSAGLIRGQPSSAGVSSATANYVTRPATSQIRPVMVPPQQKPPEKKPGSNDVIMLD
ncbi:transcriptional regulator ATRX [Procambarus clarkii]|uniref:transcriptional regulator ATRX n=2 Tax=Procambarus clarkii TaxID=6728 RepID=UPI003743EB5D